LDDELNQLPERLRAPLVLCFLEALTRDEAARRLGWSLRTLERRLHQGRARLHERLQRRGVTLAGLAAAALAPAGLRAQVPEAVSRSAVRAAISTAPASAWAAVIAAPAVLGATLLAAAGLLGLLQ